MTNPCRGCAQRSAVCHSPGQCPCDPSYEEWLADIRAKRVKERSQDAKNFLIDNIYKAKRKKNI